MKVCIVSCFDWYKERLKYVKEVFEKNGHEVLYFTSDFEHISKHYVKKLPGVNYIHTKAYDKNLSIGRILSHIDFARKVYQELENRKPDCIYALVPPNSVAKVVAKYGKKYSNTRIFFDVIDMWPESMPFNKENWLFHVPYKMWQGIRDKYIHQADIVFTECDFYQEHIKTVVTPDKLQTLHLVKDILQKVDDSKEAFEGIIFAYLGSINNILDIDGICSILSKLVKRRPVKVRLIGVGETKAVFIERLKMLGVDVADEGAIYEETEKNRILHQCDFGLNMMKKGTYVGLTTKSIDYFSAGLPVLNNIAGDTEHLVEKYDAGFNVRKQPEDMLITQLVELSAERKEQLHQNAFRLFCSNFTPEIFRSKLEERLQGIL